MIPIGDEMKRFTLRNERIVCGPIDFVVKPEGAAARLGDLRADRENIFVARWRLVPAITFGNDEKRVTFLFHLAI